MTLRDKLRRASSSMTQAEAARKFDISRAHVSKIALEDGLTFVPASRTTIRCAYCDRKRANGAKLRHSKGCLAKKWTRERIKTLRERLDMTQDQFAFLLGAGSATPTRWEAGLSSPSRHYLERLEALDA